MQLRALMFVFFVGCVFEGSSFCYEPIICSEDFYAVCVCVCACARARARAHAQETSTIRQPRPDLAPAPQKEK